MPKPLRSEDPNPPQSVQFAHFGVLNDGKQSRTSLFTSISLNILLALVVIIIGAAAKKSMDKHIKLTTLTEPIPIKKVEPEPVKPKVKLPPPPKIKIPPPKIQVPEVKLPDIPKPVEVKMEHPVPIVQPAPPKAVTPPPAPKVVNLGRAMPATVIATNHPSAVSLGQRDNPIAPSTRPSTSAINLGNRGAAGMPASNTGMGATKVSLGSGSPSSQNMAGNGAVAVRGVKLGVPGGTGPLNSTGKVAGPVNLGQIQQPVLPKPTQAAAAPASHAPRVLYKPTPQYTAEAKDMHLEGTVAVRLRVLPSGAVEVLGVSSGLGHGLDQAALRVAQGMRFSPATDSAGTPVSWEGVVNVAFQLAG